MKNQKGEDAPNFWIDPTDAEESLIKSDSSKTYPNKSKKDQNKTVEGCDEDETQQRIQEIERFADFLISTSSKDISCDKHPLNLNDEEVEIDCEECKILKEKVEKYQSHRHTFTCAKKRKTLTIRETEGHGRQDGHIKGPALINIPICRFRFPRFPLNETKVVLGLPKDADENNIKERKL